MKLRFAQGDWNSVLRHGRLDGCCAVAKNSFLLPHNLPLSRWSEKSNQSKNWSVRVSGESRKPSSASSSTAAAKGKEEKDQDAPYSADISFIRMSPNDEKLAQNNGHFLRRLIEAGVVDGEGMVTEKGQAYIERMNATHIHLTINKMLSMNKRYQTVLSVIRDVGDYIGAVNLATAMHRLGRLVRSARASNPDVLNQVMRHPQYIKLLEKTEEMMEVMKPRSLANFLWGMAALGDQENTGIVLRLGERLMQIDAASLKTQEISNVVWSLATLEMQMPDLIDRMLDAACDRIDECVPQALSNMIWACATLKHYHPRFIQLVAESASHRLDSFQSQTLANTLWAYSVLDIYPSELFNEAAEEICNRLKMKDKAKASQKAFKSLKKPRMLQNNSKSSGKGAHIKNSKAIDKEQRAYYEFRGQEISNVLIAYARGCIIHPALLEHLEAELCSAVSIEVDGKKIETERLQQFTSQALTNTLWAFATLRWYPARLLPCITQAMGRLVRSMTAQELANSLWSYARFAYHPGRVMWSFLAVMCLKIDDFEAQGCTNSLWALAVLKGTHSTAFIKLLERYIALEKTSISFGELQYNQVLQAVLLAQFEARGGRVAWRPEVDLPEDVVDRALDAWASQQTATQLSGFHLDVSEGLSRLGISHKIEHLVARDLLSIDIAVISDGRFIAIEVDGPFHFPVNARTPLGHTMIRRRLLRAAGWSVIPIPWYDWFSMETWDDRLKYLAHALAKADESLIGQLKPNVKELLSTEFSPGPGAVQKTDDLKPKENSSNIKKRTLTDEQDSPVLSYSEKMDLKSRDVETGLLEALSRSNVQLTSGAVRRLKTMGLEDIVNKIEGRRMKKDDSMEGRYSPPPSIKSGGNHAKSGLLPKPPRNFKRKRPSKTDDKLAKRFNPRFVDQNAGESKWTPYWNTEFINQIDENSDSNLNDIPQPKLNADDFSTNLESIDSSPEKSDKLLGQFFRNRRSSDDEDEDFEEK